MKSILRFLNGKKRYIGLAAIFIYGGLVSANIVAYDDTIVGIILAWTGVGYAHAAVKA